MVVLADFTGGMNSAVPPQHLQDNEFQLLKNFEYNFNCITTRGGLSAPLVSFMDNIKSVFYLETTGEYIVTLDNKDVYKVDSNFNALKAGVLVGSSKPVFCEFDSKVFIASGGKLQYVDDAELKTIEASKNCDNVFERMGRLVTTIAGDDNEYYSAVGDPYETGWTDDSNDDSTSKWLEVGYKDSGDIIKSLPIAGDIAVFKSNGRVYSISGEYPNWNIQLIAEHTDVINKEAICVVGGDIVFMTNSGLKSLQTTATYGNFGVNEIARKINRNLMGNVINPVVYNLIRKRQLIIFPNPQDNPKECYCYQYDIGAGMVFEFDAPIADMQETRSGVVIASGNSLYRWSMEYATDNGEPIKQSFVSKQYESTGRFYTRRVDFGIKGTEGEKVYFEWANKRIPYEINELRRVKQVFSVCRDSAIRFDTQAKISIEYIKLYLFEGV